MPEVKISELDVAAALAGDEQLPAVQAGVTVRTTVGDVRGDLDDLADVDTAGVTDGDVLAYNAGTWVPSGAYVTPAAGLVVNEHGADANAPRIAAAINYWVGSVEPVNGQPADLLYLEV